MRVRRPQKPTAEELRKLDPPLYRKGQRVVVLSTGARGKVWIDEDDGMVFIRYDELQNGSRSVTIHFSMIKRDEDLR